MIAAALLKHMRQGEALEAALAADGVEAAKPAGPEDEIILARLQKHAESGKLDSELRVWKMGAADVVNELLAIASGSMPRQPPLHHPNRPRSTSFPPLRALESSLRIPPAIYRTAGAMSGVRAAQGGLREAPRVELSRRPLSARASGSTDPTETSTSAGSAPSAPSTPIAARPAAAVLMRPGAPAEASVAPLAHPPPAPRPRPHRLPLLRR